MTKLKNMRVIHIPAFRAVSSGPQTFEQLFADDGYHHWCSTHPELIRDLLYEPADFLWHEGPRETWGKGLNVWIHALEDDVTAEDVAPWEMIDFPHGVYLVATADEMDSEDINETVRGMMQWIEESEVFEYGDFPLSGMCNMPDEYGDVDQALQMAQQQIFLPLKRRKRTEDTMELLKRNEEMRNFFNEKADGYDDVHLKLMDNKIAITPLLLENTQQVLDLGGGTGLELIPLFERFPQAHVTVVDISEEMLKTLRERPFAGQVDTLCGDFFLLDFGGPYDAVISSAALHHFTEEDKNTLYAKVFACLKPGGVFVNSDRCFDTLAQQEENFEEYHTNGQNYRHFDTPLCKEVEKRALEKAGFVDFTIDDMPDGRYKVIRVVKPL